MSRLQSALVDAWYRGGLWLWLLRPLELLYRSVVWIRRLLYRRGFIYSYRPGKPLLVVGNVTVGGTGKTPVVIALVEALQSQGLRPGVVSRGYGATAERYPHRVGKSSLASECGDEPLLIYRRTNCPCVVSPDRPDAVRTLLRDYDVDVVISDDGLQHYALRRDMEIAVLDAAVGVGNGFCLPAGPLREPRRRLRSVDFILYRGKDSDYDGITYQIESLVNVVTGEQRPMAPEAFQEQAFYAVSGIGRPQQFYQSLGKAGFRFESRTFPDHHRYSASDFAALGDRPILMTEKDAVKCRDLAGDNAWYVRINARLPERIIHSVAALARRDIRIESPGANSP